MKSSGKEVKLISSEKKLIAVDVDGTLASAGGVVTKEQIELLYRPDVIWGILSSAIAERVKGACEALGITPEFMVDCNLDERAQNLRTLAQKYDASRNIYVGDRGGDQEMAIQAGFEFVYAHQFAKWVQKLS